MTNRLYCSLVVAALVSNSAFARQVSLDVSMAQTKLPALKKQTTFVKVGLTGFRLTRDAQRNAVNVCLVLDKSGSMGGQKIKQAKKAAMSAINRLRHDDIVSIVTYDSTVQVIVPATKLSDRETIIQRIREITPGGSTALFAGVSKGAQEIRKFLDKNKVNRVILLSDGLANVGPKSPSELGNLGASLIKENIAVSTIGLGLDYNEDLMTQLANKSDGNHVFVEDSTDLIAVFNQEFDDVLSVVAQEIAVKIQCRDGIRPVRVLNSDADITGQEVWIKMNQLYSEQEKYIVLEVELTGKKEDEKMDIADVSISYTNMETKTVDRLSSSVAVAFCKSEEVAKHSINKEVMTACVIQLGNLKNKQATLLRDKGDILGSRKLLNLNSTFLSENADKLDSEELRTRARWNELQAGLLDEKNWKRGRKIMREFQYADDKQQRVAPRGNLTNEGGGKRASRK